MLHCRSGDHELIGSAYITLKEITPERYILYTCMYSEWFITLFRGGNVFNLDVINPEMKKRKKKYVNSGVLHFLTVQ